MKPVKVRCWPVRNCVSLDGKMVAHDLWITYPDQGMGHRLITCLACGAVYCVDQIKEVYDLALEQRLAKLTCERCGKALAENWAEYPDTYVVDGTSHRFPRESVIPATEDSEVREFPGIYD